jgi:tRNA-N(6)-(isopentenyl)adenosine-37 thiotransferase enzyme MiaB
MKLLKLINPKKLNLFLKSRYLNKLYSTNENFKQKIQTGPSLKDFLSKHIQPEEIIDNEIVQNLQNYNHEINNELKLEKTKQTVYFEVYGCQMNISDTEVAYSVLSETGNYTRVEDHLNADIILLMTCSIREGAEKKIWNRLETLRDLKLKSKKHSHIKIGLLGCMAERLKETILDKQKYVDVICGPDAYRKLPQLLDETTKYGSTAMNVQLSLDETYADISPLRINTKTKSAFISIQRGCNNMCSFCIVPFVRGRERSRPVSSIITEIRQLADQGVKDITLLGQNVNSYCDRGDENTEISVQPQLSKDFKTNYKVKSVAGETFVDLLDKASLVDPEIRIRFTSPHPKDFPDSLLYLMKERSNLCKHIHLPAQSGSTTCLERMRRGYTREAYLNLVENIRNIMPKVALTSDFISGFCGETEQEHLDTVSLIESVKYNFCFTFPYSLREKTRAYHRFTDDVPLDVKTRRHIEITNAFRNCALEVNRSNIGETHLVLVEGVSKRSDEDLAGRNDNNTTVIFGKCELQLKNDGLNLKRLPQIGDYVACKIVNASSQTLRAEPLYLCTLKDFYSIN